MATLIRIQPSSQQPSSLTPLLSVANTAFSSYYILPSLLRYKLL